MNKLLSPYFKTNNLDAFLITDLNNVRFLTNFSGTNGLVIVTKKQSYFITDSRYTEQATQQVKGYKIVEADRALFTTLNDILKSNRVKRLGVEAHHLSHAKFLRYKKLLRNVRLVPLTHDPAEVRIVKIKNQIANIKKALNINAKAFKKIKPFIKPGVTEKFIARKLEAAMLELGAEKIAFDTIIASGWRGALPHGVASDKKIGRNELVTIDFGCVVNGYHSDETVTIAVGKPHAELLKINKIVYRAQQAAFKLAGPGVKCSDLDKAARDYITNSGYGAYFGHALGHGVGLEIHERPVLSHNSEDVLKPGMVFTIEPGTYIPKLGGVRIEDVFVCTKNNAKQISKIKKLW